jgi:hypothetical protein
MGSCRLARVLNLHSRPGKLDWSSILETVHVDRNAQRHSYLLQSGPLYSFVVKNSTWGSPSLYSTAYPSRLPVSFESRVCPTPCMSNSYPVSRLFMNRTVEVDTTYSSSLYHMPREGGQVTGHGGARCCHASDFSMLKIRGRASRSAATTTATPSRLDQG